MKNINFRILIEKVYISINDEHIINLSYLVCFIFSFHNSNNIVTNFYCQLCIANINYCFSVKYFYDMCYNYYFTNIIVT
ncbi:hypothetical protein Catovirus_1_276 [Catovirus CTV1]|uniref:Uncharacterized protein n=1 Tax=Catovirus CTV1 TaxID=1977631 RepID=A0A1V0S946_9VIRU|nr:hypothetical protein Catovirus_1_276 [Catovirus CTV1]